MRCKVRSDLCCKLVCFTALGLLTDLRGAAEPARPHEANLISQTSIPYDRYRTGGDPLAKLPFDDPRLADTSGGLNPSQVLSYTIVHLSAPTNTAVKAVCATSIMLGMHHAILTYGAEDHV